jgi:Holliday junction resolvase RusA-like endonuclease
MKHVFHFPLPPTLNEQIREARSHWSISAKTKTEWTGIIAMEAHGSPTFPNKVWIDFVWGLPKFSRDPDNVSAAAKYIFDGLAKAKVIKNDNLTVVQSPVIHWYERDHVPSVMVTIADSPSFLIERMKEFHRLYDAAVQ